jgi:predicted ArsR family transcriptional regulator
MGDTAWDLAGLLAEPTRRAAYDAARAARAPLTRDEVAAALGITTKLAAFHLDRLAEAGLLDVDYARPPGRTGPGAGRPAKRYAVAACEVSVSAPPRRYDLAVRILAAGAAAGRDATAATLAAAEDEGRRAGAARRSAKPLSRRATLAVAADVLASLGYEPAVARGTVRLRNCPFDAGVQVAPEVVCGMNERFVAGLLAGLNADPAVVPLLDPAPPDCCVRIASRP